jgi:hypothetical protein
MSYYERALEGCYTASQFILHDFNRMAEIMSTRHSVNESPVDTRWVRAGGRGSEGGPWVGCALTMLVGDHDSPELCFA